MTDIVQLYFKANTAELDAAKEKLADIARNIPGVSGGIDLLGSVFGRLNAPVAGAITLFGAAAAATTKLGMSAIKAADDLNDLQEAIGYTSAELQTLDVIAAKNGGSRDEMITIFMKLSKAMIEAKDATSNAGKALEYMGIKLYDANGKMKDQQKLAQEIATYWLESTKTANDYTAVAELLTKGFIKQAVAIAATKDKADEYNKLLKTEALVTDELRVKSDAYNDTLKDVSMVFQGLGNRVARELLPALQGMADAFLSSYKNGGMVKWMLIELGGAANLVANVLKTIASAVIILDTGLLQLGKTIGAVAASSYFLFNERDFSKAKQVWVEYYADVKKLSEENFSIIGKMWEKATVHPTEFPGLGSTGGKKENTNPLDFGKEKKPEHAFETDAMKADKALADMIERYYVMNKEKEKDTELTKVLAELETSRYISGSEAYKKMVIDAAKAIDLKNAEKKVDADIARNREDMKQYTTYIDAQIDALTMTNDQLQEQNALDQVHLTIIRQIKDIEKQYGADSQEAIEAKNRLLKQQKGLYADIREETARLREAQGNWLNGVISGINEYTSGLVHLADRTKNLTLSIIGSLTDALVNFATTGKLNFQSMLSDMSRMVARFFMEQAVMGLLKLAFGAFMPSVTPNTGTGTFGGISLKRAEGGPLMAGQTALIGEKGPELWTAPTNGTVIPNHMLGGSNVTQVNNVTVNVKGGNTNAETGAAVSDAVFNAMKNLVRQEIGTAIRPGGALNPMGIRG